MGFWSSGCASAFVIVLMERTLEQNVPTEATTSDSVFPVDSAALHLLKYTLSSHKGRQERKETTGHPSIGYLSVGSQSVPADPRRRR